MKKIFSLDDSDTELQPLTSSTLSNAAMKTPEVVFISVASLLMEFQQEADFYSKGLCSLIAQQVDQNTKHFTLNKMLGQQRCLINRLWKATLFMLM